MPEIYNILSFLRIFSVIRIKKISLWAIAVLHRTWQAVVMLLRNCNPSSDSLVCCMPHTHILQKPHGQMISDNTKHY